MIRDNMSNGRTNGASLLTPEDATIRPEEYYVHPRLRDDFEDLKTVIAHHSDFGSEMGARSYLFTGPPGTGKTLAARVLAAELHVPLFDISSLIKGQSQVVAQVFDELRKAAQESPKGVLALIDEIDGLASRDDIVDPLQNASMTQVLSQIDGTQNNDGVFIIGTTNRPNGLDEGMRSRFGEEIEFLPPDTAGRRAILDIHAHGKGGHAFTIPDDDLAVLASRTYGYVGRDLRNVLNRAFTHAKRNDRIVVEMVDLEYALAKTKPSAIKDMPFVEPTVRLDDMVGYDDHKALLASIVRQSAESVILLYGPKGTGKTYAAEALAGEFGYNFILIKGSELENKFVGQTKDNTERILRRAKLLAPCIVCFDEISSFVERRGLMTHKDSQTGYLQSVLSRPPEGVYVIGTDNSPEFLKGPFADRFIHRLYFGMPTSEEQTSLWGAYAPGIDAQRLVGANSELSCRDIANACRRVREYGVPLSVESLTAIVGHVPHEDTRRYDEVIRELGDGVADYRALKGIAAGMVARSASSDAVDRTTGGGA